MALSFGRRTGSSDDESGLRDIRPFACAGARSIVVRIKTFSDCALRGGGLRALCQVWAYARRRWQLQRDKCRSSLLQFDQFPALALFPHPAVHHVRVDAVTQHNAGKRRAWLATLLQHASLELRAVLTPPRALYLERRGSLATTLLQMRRLNLIERGNPVPLFYTLQCQLSFP